MTRPGGALTGAEKRRRRKGGNPGGGPGGGGVQGAVARFAEKVRAGDVPRDRPPFGRGRSGGWGR